MAICGKDGERVSLQHRDMVRTMNKKILVPIAILLVAGLVFFMNTGPSVPVGYQDFRAVDAQAALAGAPDVKILDVRTPAEYAGGHISGAENIDFYAKDFEARMGALDRDARYFVYCRTGNRSSSVIKLMQRLGFTKVWHLSNGVVDWMGAGLPLVR